MFTSVGNPLVYLFALGVGLASLVTDRRGRVSYLVFVAPALLASAAVTVAAEESTYPVMMGFKWNPIFFAMNAAPISGNQIVNGVIIGMLVRMLPTCVVYFVVMLFFGAVPGPFGSGTTPRRTAWTSERHRWAASAQHADDHALAIWWPRSARRSCRRRSGST